MKPHLQELKQGLQILIIKKKISSTVRVRLIIVSGESLSLSCTAICGEMLGGCFSQSARVRPRLIKHWTMVGPGRVTGLHFKDNFCLVVSSHVLLALQAV